MGVKIQRPGDPGHPGGSRRAALRRQGFSRKHRATIRAAPGGIFRRAVAAGLLTRNPADAITGKLGREDREVRQVEWLTEPELRGFLEQAKALEPRHYPTLLTLAATGIRQGGALGLQVGNVDLTRYKLSLSTTDRVD
jgi:integrase